MSISRLLPLAVVVALLGAASPALDAQQRNQPRRTNEEQRDLQALVQMVDAVVAGKQPAPSDIQVTWESNDFVRGGDGTTYIPFTLSFPPGQLAMSGVAAYVRVMTKEQVAAASGTAEPQNTSGRRNENQRVAYPWDNVYFADIGADGKLSRPIALKGGEYEVIVAVKEKSVRNPPRNAPPAKFGLLRRPLSVPDFNGPDLTTSSVLVANLIEPLAAPLDPQQQQENPYTFGAMRVVPAPEKKVKKSGELHVLFWIYGAQQTNGKPDLTIDYNFHQKTAEGEKYFNKTAPQVLNALTLPPEFSVALGHQLPGSLVVPLMSFPEGEYRLEIKITDKVSGKTLTQNATFTVEA